MLTYGFFLVVETSFDTTNTQGALHRNRKEYSDTFNYAC